MQDLLPEVLQEQKPRDWLTWRSPPPADEVIPRFVASENYAKNFGDQWERYPLTQLDSHSGLKLSEERLRRCLGETLWAALPGKTVLECGCGAGRFTEVLLNRGARVVSVDLSSAVDVNAILFPVSEQHRVVQADIMALPFQEKQFDIVLCMGVLQHTENTEKSMEALFMQVKNGGSLVVDHYCFENSYISLRYFYRQIFKRLESRRSMAVLSALSKIFLPLHKYFRSSYFWSMVLNRFSPFVTYYRSIPDLRDNLQEEWALLDTFDTLTDWYKRFRNPSQIYKALLDVGATNIWCEIGGNGVEARAMRSL